MPASAQRGQPAARRWWQRTGAWLRAKQRGQANARLAARESASAPAGLGHWVLELTERRLTLGAQARQLLDLPADSAPTLDIDALLAPMDPGSRAVLVEALLRAGDGGSGFDLDLPWPDVAGGQRFLRWMAQPVRAAAARHRLDGSVLDVTRQRQAGEALAEQHHLAMQLLRTTSQGVWWVDAEGRTRDLNPAMCELLGRHRVDVIGRHATEFFDGEALQTLQRELRARSGGQPGRYEIDIHRPDGSSRRCRNVATPVYDRHGRRTGSFGLWTDLTEHEDARLKLETATEHLRATLDATGDAIFATDAADARQPVRFANAAMLRMWGFSDEQGATLTAEQIMAVATPLFADPEAQVARIRSLIAAGDSAEDLVPLRDGRLLLRRFVASQVHGRRLRVWSFRDITAERRALADAQQREAEQRSLLDAFPGYIARLDANGHYTYVNRRLGELLGHDPAQMLGRTVAEVLGDDRARFVADALRRCLAGEAVSFEHVAPASGERAELVQQVTLAAGVCPVSGAPAVFAFGSDITGLKRAQHALREAKEEAERANLAKSSFLSHLSHELRTPLNAMLGFAQVLQAEPAPALADGQREQASHIVRGGRHLLALLDDLLDMARIDAARLQVQLVAVPLASVLDECLEMLAPMAQAHRVSLPPPSRGDGSPWVRADRTRLEQVLMNLLSNAIKYNRRGGWVEVGCRSVGEQVSIEVRDSGRGLQASQISLLFRPFERLDAQHGPIEGTGIGLALCKGLVEAMGGAIEVDSVPGTGSTFRVRLPRWQGAAPQALAALPALAACAASEAPAVAPAGDGGRLTVLHVEDNVVNQLLMEAMLRALPQLEVANAADADTGFELALRLRPALILSDIQLPGADGYELLRRLRGEAATRAIPVVAVSAGANPGDMAAAREAGFADYLCKPLNRDELLATVQRYLRSAAEPAGRAAGAAAD